MASFPPTKSHLALEYTQFIYNIGEAWYSSKTKRHYRNNGNKLYRYFYGGIRFSCIRFSLLLVRCAFVSQVLFLLLLPGYERSTSTFSFVLQKLLFVPILFFPPINAFTSKQRANVEFKASIRRCALVAVHVWALFLFSEKRSDDAINFSLSLLLSSFTQSASHYR
eukprot:gene11023-7659_t